MVVLSKADESELPVAGVAPLPVNQRQKSQLVKQKSEGSLWNRPAFSFSSTKSSMYDNYTCLSISKETGAGDKEFDELQRKRIPKMSKGSRKLIGYEILPKKKPGQTNTSSSSSHGVSSSSSSNNSIGLKAKQPKISGNLDDEDDDEGYDIVYDSTKDDGVMLMSSVPNSNSKSSNTNTTNSNAKNDSTTASGLPNSTSYYSDSNSSSHTNSNSNTQANASFGYVLPTLFVFRSTFCLFSYNHT